MSPDLLLGPPEGRPYRSEEDAKIRWIVPLLEQFGHDLHGDMSFEVPVRWQAGVQEHTGFADIVVYVGDIPIIIVETKKAGESLTRARNQAITYAKSYSPIVPFVVAHDRSSVRLYRASAQQDRLGEYVLVEDFPTRAELLALIGLSEELPAAAADRERAVARVIESEHYRYLLAECVRIVLSDPNVEGVPAVAELSKILLTKAYHEGHSTGRFRPGGNMAVLFNEAKVGFPELFRAGETIGVSRATFDQLVTKLAEVEVTGP